MVNYIRNPGLVGFHTILVPVSELIGFADVIISPACLASEMSVAQMVGRSAFQDLSFGVMV